MIKHYLLAMLRLTSLSSISTALKKKGDDAEYEKDAAKAHLEQFQSGQQRYQSAVSRVQSENVELSAGLAKDRDYFICRLDHSNDQIFKGFVKKAVNEGRQITINIYEESKKTVNVYADGWPACLNALCKTVADFLAAPALLN